MSTTTAAVKPKIYHLLDDSNVSVEHYQRVNANQRVKVEKRKDDRPYLQLTFQDKDGLNRTIRFKLNCNTPYQDEQIEKFKIPANEKYTTAELNMPRFKNGVLVVSNAGLQKFLDITPQNEKFEGELPENVKKLFREYNPQDTSKAEVNAFKKRAQLAAKIVSLNLEEAQSMLLRENGSFYKPPTELDDCILELVAVMDDSSDEEVENMLRDGVSLEDEITILIGKATQSGSISFDEPGMENFVVKKVGDRSVPLKEISATLPPSDRRRLFSEFLASNDGTLHLQDLRKMVDAKEEAKEPAKPEEENKEVNVKPLNQMNKAELTAKYVEKFKKEPETAMTNKELAAAIEAE